MQLIEFGNPRDIPPDDECGEGLYAPRNYGEPACTYRVSKAFEVVAGRRMPVWLEIESLTAPDRLGDPKWFARVELWDRIPKIASIGFESSLDVDREVKGSDFQRVRSVIYVFYAAFCADVDAAGEPVHRADDDADKRIAEFLEQRRTGRQRLKTADYQRAAEVYRDNFDGTPTQAVADAFGVGIRQGGNIVAECRRRGFLPKTKQGRKKA